MLHVTLQGIQALDDNRAGLLDALSRGLLAPASSLVLLYATSHRLLNGSPARPMEPLYDAHSGEPHESYATANCISAKVLQKSSRCSLPHWPRHLLVWLTSRCSKVMV